MNSAKLLHLQVVFHSCFEKKEAIELAFSFFPDWLTSLEGLTLSSPLPTRYPGFDEQLMGFTRSFPALEQLNGELQRHQKDFMLRFTTDAFDFGPALRQLGYHRQQQPWTQAMKGDISPLQNVGGKFLQEVKRILRGEEYLTSLAVRLEKAGDYFRPRIIELEQSKSSD